MKFFAIPLRRYCTQIPSSSFYDVVIVGGGLVGSAMACSIGRNPQLSHKRVLLIDSAKALAQLKQRGPDEFSNRVSAISPSSVQLFKRLNVWDQIRTRAQPISALNVEDGCSGAKITFEQLNSNSPIAWIVENERIVHTFHECLQQNCPNVEWHKEATYNELSIPENLGENVSMQLENGKTVECGLLIAADGANSKVREWSGIGHQVEDYGQMSIVATLHIANQDSTEENMIAWQRFMPLGPIAILPLNNAGMSSLVWTTSTEEAKRLLEQPKEQFVMELNNALIQMDTTLQTRAINGPLDSFSALLNFLPLLNPPSKFAFPSVLGLPQDDRAAFPLTFAYAKDYVGHRIALIGDAAHRVHPLAGQGVNLGWSDVSNLTLALETAVQEGGDLGSLTYLREFDDRSQRRNVPVATAIDCLNHLFSTDSAPSVFLRSIGFNFLDRLLPVKDLIVRMAS